MTQARSAPPDLAGFDFVQGVGGGGFADVFLYRQHQMTRSVAIKVLRAEHLSEAALQQFALEADLMAQVSAHPYIVTIYTAGVATDGRPYIVMEYYPGQHFGLRARGRRLAVAEVIKVGIQVAAALEAAHRAGILHRDVKPANILTSEYGRPGLTDFGIAGVQAEGGGDAALGVTVAFSAPEVLLDPMSSGSVATDVYAFGATLSSLIAGHSPCWVPGGNNDDASVFERAVNNQLTPLARPDVPRSLVLLLEHATARSPGSRPQSMLAFARALQNIELELSLAPTPLELPESAGPQVPTRQPTESAVEDEDGTRRSMPKVVDPEGPAQQAQPAPIRGIPKDLVGPAPAPPTPQTHRASEPSSYRPASRWGTQSRAEWGPDAVVENPETIRREAPPPPDDSQASGSRMGLMIAVAVGVVTLVGVGIFLVRPKDPNPPPTTAAPIGSSTVTLPLPPPDSPVNVTASLNPSNELTVSFQNAPTGPGGTPPSSPSGLRYRVMRTNGRFPDGNVSVDVDVPPATIGGFVAGDQPCVTVSAVLPDGRISEPSAQACATSTS